MERLRLHTGALAALALTSSLGLAACGQGGASEQAQRASDTERIEQERRAEERADGNEADGESVRGGDGGNGEDGESVRGEDGESSSQSSSVTQSGSGDQSTSIVQRSDSGSTSSSSSISGAGVKTFSGSGATTLSFNVEERARLAWTNSEGEPFSARGNGISIESSAGRGEVPLEPGRYDDVQVRGSKWTIVVRPR